MGMRMRARRACNIVRRLGKLDAADRTERGARQPVLEARGVHEVQTRAAADRLGREHLQADGAGGVAVVAGGLEREQRLRVEARPGRRRRAVDVRRWVRVRLCGVRGQRGVVEVAR